MLYFDIFWQEDKQMNCSSSSSSACYDSLYMIENREPAYDLFLI